MLSKPELFDAVKALTPHQRTFYEIGLSATTIGAGFLSGSVVIGLSVLLAEWLVTSDLSSDALIGVAIMPGIMSFLFAAGNINRISKPGLTKKQAMSQAGWRGIRTGFIVGLVVLSIIHFLGQLLLARAIYGPFTSRSEISNYCGVYPLVYGVLFAFPVALGTGLFAMYLEVSAQVIYELVVSVRRVWSQK